MIIIIITIMKQYNRIFFRTSNKQTVQATEQAWKGNGFLYFFPNSEKKKKHPKERSIFQRCTYIMSSSRCGVPTQSKVLGSEAAMIMHINCFPVLLSMG